MTLPVPLPDRPFRRQQEKSSAPVPRHRSDVILLELGYLSFCFYRLSKMLRIWLYLSAVRSRKFLVPGSTYAIRTMLSSTTKSLDCLAPQSFAEILQKVSRQP
jgi:hypothetical protein